MKHLEAIFFRDKITAVTGLIGYATKIAIRRNIAKLEIATKPLIDEQNEIDELMKDFQSESNKIYKTLSDGKLKASIIQGKRVDVFDVPESKKAQLKTEIDSLELKHKKSIEQYQERSEKFQEFLKTADSSFNPIMIPLSQIEEFDQTISQENLDALWPIIIDDTIEKEEKETNEIKN